MGARVNLNDTGIVVIGRNEGGRLVACLTSAKPAGDAVVYVDSGSTDGSITAARRLGAVVVELDRRQPFTAARARNAGFASLRLRRPDIRFVQFVDGDCTLAAGWLEASSAFMRPRPELAVVCGRRRERNPQMSIYNRLCDAEWDTPVGPATACGGDSLVRVEAFEAVGGFCPQLICGEEPEFCVRLRQAGWRIWRLDAEMTLHDIAMSRFSQWWLRTTRAGHGFAEVSWLHRTSAFRIWARETRSAVAWSSLALAIGIAGFFHPLVLAGFAVFPLQVCRLAVARGGTDPFSWSYGLFITLAKFAEFQGILTYWWRRIRGNTIKLIEYK